MAYRDLVDVSFLREAINLGVIEEDEEGYTIWDESAPKLNGVLCIGGTDPQGRIIWVGGSDALYERAAEWLYNTAIDNANNG